MKTIAAVVLALAASSSPLAAQPASSLNEDQPAVSIRGFVFGSLEQMSAKTTFDGVFGKSAQPFWGGGAQLVFRLGPFVEVSGSQFKKDGQRAFLFNGQAFRLGIPLKAAITPVELSGGYRFHLFDYPDFHVYLSAGVGWYGYKETFSAPDAADSVDTRTKGYLATVGVEQRLHRWVAFAVDGQYTHVPGVLGTGGLSKDANEKDLGGIAVRFRAVVGR